MRPAQWFSTLLVFSACSSWLASGHAASEELPMDIALAALSQIGFTKEEAPGQTYDLKGQMTYIFQDKPTFSANYTLPGYNSLSPDKEQSHSFTATGYLGYRPWSGAEVYFNEEMVLGVPFSGLTGLASVPNAELQKASGPDPIFYIPRIFIRQTWDLGNSEYEYVLSGFNQLAGYVDSQRLVMSAGKMSVVDIFDNNSFAHDGRKDFFNWVNVTYGAFDYAADVRGYTWGAALEYYRDDWVVRAGRFAVPRQSNGLQLNYSIMNFHGDQIEIERDYQIANQSGKLRFLAFRNRELMGRFDDAIVYASEKGDSIPDVSNVRRTNTKHGYGVNLEQDLTSNLGVFARTSWNDGGTEMFSYTETERSNQVGLSLNGTQWGRSDDTLGLAFVENELSTAHQEYLSLGGTGFLIGDGKLNYRPERAVESYYSFAIAKKSWISFDFQHFNNPAYNADRGPLYVLGMRAHTEF